MADWSADDRFSDHGHGCRSHSRQSSGCSDRSLEDAFSRGSASRSKADTNGDGISTGSGSSAGKGIELSGGSQLTEESVTDHRNGVYKENGISTNGVDSVPRIPPKEPFITGKMKKPAPQVPTITTAAPVETIPEEDITIPKDGCLYNFTAEEMATFFRYMRIEDRLVNHYNRKGLNGKRFSFLTDADLENGGINNPIIRHFRDRSIKKSAKGRMNFIL